MVVAVAIATGKAQLVHLDFKASGGIAVFACIGAGGDSSRHHDHFAFGDMFGKGFGSLAPQRAAVPGDALLLLSVGVLPRFVAGEAEACDGDTRRREAEFGIVAHAP